MGETAGAGVVGAGAAGGGVVVVPGAGAGAGDVTAPGTRAQAASRLQRSVARSTRAPKADRAGIRRGSGLEVMAVRSRSSRAHHFSASCCHWCFDPETDAAGRA